MNEGSSDLAEQGDRANMSEYQIYLEGEYPDEIRLTLHLVLAARRWRSMLDENLRVIGQSAARMEALSAIMHSPSLSAQVDIAKRLRIEGPTMTRMLDTLEKDGLVQRLPDPNDRRTKQLRLTPAGEQALDQIFAIAADLRTRLLDGLTPERVKAENDFFSMLLARLDAGLPRNQAEAAE